MWFFDQTSIEGHQTTYRSPKFTLPCTTPEVPLSAVYQRHAQFHEHLVVWALKHVKQPGAKYILRYITRRHIHRLTDLAFLFGVSVSCEWCRKCVSTGTPLGSNRSRLDDNGIMNRCMSLKEDTRMEHAQSIDINIFTVYYTCIEL